MKIVAFGASNSQESINKALASYAARLLKSEFYPNAEIEILDIKDFDLPIFGVDLEKVLGKPEPARRFFEIIGAADVLLISYAEHNGHYPAVFKNLFDWTSRISGEVYQNKPAVFLSTSPGKGGAQSVLAAAVNSAVHFAADVKGSLSVPSFHENFDLEKDRLVNNTLQAELVSALKALQ